VILLLVPLVGAVLGVGLYLVLRAAGVLNVLGSEPAPRSSRSTRETWGAARARRDRSERVTLLDRVDIVPHGCLYGIIAITAIWIIGWLVVLIFGLSLLS
jgi:hypothetical protein